MNDEIKIERVEGTEVKVDRIGVDMRVEMKLKLRPFGTPNYVLAEQAPKQKQDGWTSGPKWALSEVPPETLSELCDRFRADIFIKAGVGDPQHKGEK